MKPPPIRLTRGALYERVWVIPLSELAKELGLAGTTLTTICRRHGIPTPRPGHWMKKEFGKRVEQPPLEDVDGMSAETEVILAAAKTYRSAAPAKPQRHRQVSPTAPPSQPVSNAPKTADSNLQGAETNLHPLLASTQTKLHSPPVASLARSGGKNAFSVTVGPDLTIRALRVLDALVRAVETQGWSIKRSENGLQLCPDNEAVGFTLVEQTERVPHNITNEEREAQSRFEIRRASAARRGAWFGVGSPPQVPEWDYRPTGRLVLQLDPNPYAFGTARGLRRTFNESRSRRLEDQIGKIIETLAARAAATKEIRRLQAEREAQWADEAARRKEAERRQRLEVKRLEFLERQLERHAMVRQLQGFLERYDTFDLSDEPDAETFLTWARGRLATLDNELSPEALGLRFAKAELTRDEADIPSWRKVEYPPRVPRFREATPHARRRERYGTARTPLCGLQSDGHGIRR